MRRIWAAGIAAALSFAIPASTFAEAPTTASCVGQKVSAEATTDRDIAAIVTAFLQILGGRTFGDAVSDEGPTHLEDCP